MPEYLSPGVYIEEAEMGAKPIEGVSTSTAGFIGITERGPTKPTAVSGFTEFSLKYGSYVSDSLTAYAVEGFFHNGGQRCYVSRVVKNGATPAVSAAGFQLAIKAVGPGAWGNHVAVRIEAASSEDPDAFKLIVAYWKALPVSGLGERGETKEQKRRNLQILLEAAWPLEVYDNLSTSPSSSDFIYKKINGVSNLIMIDESAPLVKPAPAASFSMEALSGGEDGAANLTRNELRGDLAAAPGSRTGLAGFGEIDDINIIYVPDIHSLGDNEEFAALADDVLTQCETLKDRFAVFDFKQGNADVANLNVTSSPFRKSKYGAVYYPWIEILDPLTNRKKLIPPGGHIVGIYARSDQERGVHKAPANEVVKGAIGLEFPVTKGTQDLLNPKNVNCIRNFSGRSIYVWGARTMELDPLWKYVNVRRLFIYLEESIDKGTQWVVFEPNDVPLWSRVRQSISQFLTNEWRKGALAGATPEEAFFVKCDRTTMTQDDIDNGRLICLIGVAPVKPAEFVVFRIAQWTAGAKS